MDVKLLEQSIGELEDLYNQTSTELLKAKVLCQRLQREHLVLVKHIKGFDDKYLEKAVILLYPEPALVNLKNIVRIHSMTRGAYLKGHWIGE